MGPGESEHGRLRARTKGCDAHIVQVEEGVVGRGLVSNILFFVAMYSSIDSYRS